MGTFNWSSSPTNLYYRFVKRRFSDDRWLIAPAFPNGMLLLQGYAAATSARWIGALTDAEKAEFGTFRFGDNVSPACRDLLVKQPYCMYLPTVLIRSPQKDVVHKAEGVIKNALASSIDSSKKLVEWKMSESGIAHGFIEPLKPRVQGPNLLLDLLGSLIAESKKAGIDQLLDVSAFNSPPDSAGVMFDITTCGKPQLTEIGG